MKLSNETRDVLKNFAAINSNIVFNGGNEIKTVATAKNILAFADVNEPVSYTHLRAHET